VDFVGEITFDGPFTGESAIGDGDDDGRSDLAIVTLDGSVEVFFQRSQTFGAPVPDLVLDTGASGQRVAIGDVNADGFSDIVVRGPGSFLVYLQEDAMPSLIRPIPSTYALNRGTVAKGLIDLRRYFADDHNRLMFSLELESDPDHIHATVNGGSLDFEAFGTWHGTAQFRVTAWDGNPAHASIESNAFTVLVNEPPRITGAPPLRAAVGQPYAYVVGVEDEYPANDPHTFSLITGPEGMTVDSATGLVAWTPTEAQRGDHAVAIEVRDGNGGSAVQEFTIVVAPTTAGPSAALLAVGVAASSAALLAAAGLINENAKWLFLLFFVPLYTKIKRERVLDHFVRGQIFGYIQANPGEHYNAIKDALGLTNGSLAHHLRTLEREQFVKSKRYGLYRRFYPMNYRMPADDVYQPNEIQATILAVIRDHPGITQKEIAGRLGLTPPTVNYHVAVLIDRNLILVERRGRSTHCTIIEGAQT
jgi:predicted transcriptional regulator